MPVSPSKDPPSSLQPSTFKSSLKWKMFTLVGMLVMVIYSMNEAGKPENWAWMGFEKSGNTRKVKKTEPPALASAGSEITSDNNGNSLPKVNEINAANSTTSPLPPNQTATSKSNPTRYKTKPAKVIRLTEVSPSFAPTNQPTELPTESAKFWSSFFGGLTTAEQVEWMDLLDTLLSEATPASRAPVTETQTKLIARAEQQRESFDNDMLNRIAPIPHTSKKRSQLTQDRFDANKFWDKQISPALNAFSDAQDLTLTQRQAVVDLLHHLEMDALDLVKDKTAVGWTGDSIAWKRSWNRIHQTKADDLTFANEAPTFVKRIQLVGQPQEFRGKAIKVYGFVRAVETRSGASDSSYAWPRTENGAKVTYYVVWVQPSDSEAGPYCVYCLDLPAELPDSREELAGFERLATINGIFFKNRTFEQSDGKVEYCPLILANGFDLKPPPLKLDRNWMAAGLALVPVIGVGIAWYAVRSTVSRKRLPSKKTQEETEVFLSDLKNDPSIKTDLEKIQAIAEHEDDIL